MSYTTVTSKYLSGAIKKKVDYKNTIIHGLVTYYTCMGQILFQAYYVNGTIDKIYVGYDANGKLCLDPRPHD